MLAKFGTNAESVRGTGRDLFKRYCLLSVIDQDINSGRIVCLESVPPIIFAVLYPAKIMVPGINTKNPGSFSGHPKTWLVRGPELLMHLLFPTALISNSVDRSKHTRAAPYPVVFKGR